MTQYLIAAPVKDLFTRPDQFKAIYNGRIYIGAVDQDPLNPTNQIPIYVMNEDDSRTQVAQPIPINSGGYATYNGSPAKFVCDAPYSIAVLDVNGAEVWRSPDIRSIDLSAVVHNDIAERGAQGAHPASAITDGTRAQTVQQSLDGVFDNLSTINSTASFYVLPSGGDDTAAIQALLDAGATPRLAKGTYNISSLTLGGGAVLLTSGKETVIQQQSGLVGDIRTINITGNRVLFAPEGVTIKGNISTDTGEQRHGIFIRNNAAEQVDVTVGDVWGEDIRGDAVYVGGTYAMPDGSAAIKHVKIGKVYGKNIYRNIVSITNNVDEVDVGDIYEDITSGCSICAIDIEPDNSGKPCKNIRVGNVVGKRVGAASQFGSTRINVTFGNLDLNETRHASSTPAYNPFTSANDFYGRCMLLRNADVVVNGSVSMTNARRNPVSTFKTGGDLASTLVVNGVMSISNCNTEAGAVKDLIALNGARWFDVAELNVIALDAVNEFAISGNTGLAETRVRIGKVNTSNCRLARFCGLDIGGGSVSNTGDLYIVQNLNLPSVIRGAVISSGRVSASNTAQLQFDSCNITWSGSLKYAGTPTAGAHVVEINCNVNGVWAGLRVDDVAVTVP